jgi:glucose-6-phosphate dehydrogenase assembly protein OpcA
MQQIPVTTTLDIGTVERELGLLWKHSATERRDETGAVMRARVANVIIVMPGESHLEDINATVSDLSTVHPCRALIVLTERDAEDRDIQLYISSFCHKDSRGGQRLSCEEVVLTAHGKFVPELPSAALPLLIPELPTFLWWRDRLDTSDKTFQAFSNSADRLIIDTSESEASQATLVALARFFESEDQLAISDINWARLTYWRDLLASFYDSPKCKTALASVTSVVIEYSAPEADRAGVAPQALLLAGWLASRLRWQLSSEPAQQSSNCREFELTRDGRRVQLQLILVERPDIKPGRLARVVLTSEDQKTSFVLLRHENGLHLSTHVRIEDRTYPGRVLPVRNRTAAQLLGRELEILNNDIVYTESVRMAATMVEFCLGKT